MTNEPAAETEAQSQERYLAAAHAMQTAVALDMERGNRDTEPKHLRVGVNSALCSNSGLAALLIGKGLITRAEYGTAMADAMEAEVVRYRGHLELPPNVTLS